MVVQNDVGNRYSSTAIIVPLTDRVHIKRLSPIYVTVKKGDGGTIKDSVVLCDQIRTVDQKRFGSVYGTLHPDTMVAVNQALRISLGLSLWLTRFLDQAAE